MSADDDAAAWAVSKAGVAGAPLSAIEPANGGGAEWTGLVAALEIASALADMGAPVWLPELKLWARSVGVGPLDVWVVPLATAGVGPVAGPALGVVAPVGLSMVGVAVEVAGVANDWAVVAAGPPMLVAGWDVAPLMVGLAEAVGADGGAVVACGGAIVLGGGEIAPLVVGLAGTVVVDDGGTAPLVVGLWVAPAAAGADAGGAVAPFSTAPGAAGGTEPASVSPSEAASGLEAAPESGVVLPAEVGPLPFASSESFPLTVDFNSSVLLADLLSGPTPNLSANWCADISIPWAVRTACMAEYRWPAQFAAARKAKARVEFMTSTI